MKRSILLLFLAVLLFGSCVSTSIRSNKAPDFNEKITKIYLLMRGSDSANDFFFDFRNELNKYFKVKGIEMKSYAFDPLSLETEQQLMERINEYQPQVVMLVNQTEARSTSNAYYGWNLGRYSTPTGGTFDVQLRGPNEEKILWRASLNTDGNFGIATTATKAAKQLYQKMEEDGLIP